MSSEASNWRRCSSCKKDIDHSVIYWVCNVSTCNRKRTGMVFCTVSCWETHVPVMRHRESWAVEEKSPTREAWQREQNDAKPKSTATRPPRRTLVRPNPTSAPRGQQEVPTDILIVASKLKQYIKAVSGMNTSDGVMEKLSQHVRALCDQAIREAERAERRTVMDRDYPDV